MKNRIAFLVMVVLLALGALPGNAQNKPEEKTKPKVSPTGEIQLDALHLEAHIEKPSVSIVPKRIEPELQEVEFILRSFDRELRRVPREVFSFQGNWNRTVKIRDLDNLLSGRSAKGGQKLPNRAK